MNTEIKAQIHLISDAPFFGGYLAGSTKEGQAQIMLCLENCAGAANTREEFETMVKETLAHELLHAIEDKFDQMFSETLINDALGHPNEMNEAEDMEDMIQQIVQDNHHLQIEVERWRGSTFVLLGGFIGLALVMYLRGY